MDKPAKKIVKKLLGTDKKTTIAKPDSEKTPEELDKNYRPQGSDEQIGDLGRYGRHQRDLITLISPIKLRY